MAETKFTEALAEEIISRLWKGETLTAICRGDHMPTTRTVANWRHANKDFDKDFNDAMLGGCHALIDEMLEIIDDTAESPESRRVRVWGRDQIIRRKRPQEFSEKVQHQHAGKLTLESLVAASMEAAAALGSTSSDADPGED